MKKIDVSKLEQQEVNKINQTVQSVLVSGGQMSESQAADALVELITITEIGDLIDDSDGKQIKAKEEVVNAEIWVKTHGTKEYLDELAFFDKEAQAIISVCPGVIKNSKGMKQS